MLLPNRFAKRNPDLPSPPPERRRPASETTVSDRQWTSGAVWIGFANPIDIRNLSSSARFGGDRHCCHGGNSEPGAASNRVLPGRKQAIYITAKPETAEATDITIEIVERLDAYERGFKIPPSEQPVLTPDDRSAVGGIMKRVFASQIRPLVQMQAADHANIVALKQEIAAIKAAPVAEPGWKAALSGLRA
jgi:hypothetical protein